jgi:acyl-CoA synthetase (NDP forming)/GNAT superfamily N-acetyltransferase
MMRQVAQGVPVLLTDGSVASIRPLDGSDADALVEVFRSASEQNLYWRFFGIDREAGTRYVQRLMARVGLDQLALVVELHGQLVGLGTADPISSTAAEIAFFVADSMHGKGVGTLLLEHLAAAGRDRGLFEYEAEVLSSNYPMLEVLAAAGYDIVETRSGPEVTMRMSLEATTRAIEAAAGRERVAETASLRPLLRPRSIAVAGASRRRRGIGYTILRRIESAAYAGPVYALHPAASRIGGFPAAPTIADLGHIPDLLVVAVPSQAVESVLTEAAAAGVGAAVIITAGFGERGDAGVEQQRRLVDLCRAGGMRIVGPNCLGISIPELGVEANFAATSCKPGSLAIASQSGGVGIALLTELDRAGLGLASFVSLGNKADVSGNDLLAVWTDDPDVAIGALYLESFGNPQKFARIARTFSKVKPLVAVIGGTSAEGARAGASHTASAASPKVTVDAILRHAGVIRVDDVDELVSTVQMLTWQPPPAGRRVAVIGNVGGVGVLAADAAARHGLVVPELSNGVKQAILEGVPHASVTNPVDLGAGGDAAAFRRSIEMVITSGEVDALVVCVAVTAVNDARQILTTAAAAVVETAPRLPSALVVIGITEEPTSHLRGIPVYWTTEAAMAALGRSATYASWRVMPDGRIPTTPPTIRSRARAIARSAAQGWMPPEEARALLACYEVEAPTGTVATRLAEIRAAADQVDGPMFVKVADPNVLHRTDSRLVVAVDDADAAVDAAQEFARILGRRDVPVLVQRKESGLELAVGVTRDERFGPLVMVGAGGVAIDVWDDRQFLLPPVSDSDVARALRALRIWPLLTGLRGLPALDVAGVERLVASVAALAFDVPEVSELDLNPVVVTQRATYCVDAKLRVTTPIGLRDDPAAPRLRDPA